VARPLDQIAISEAELAPFVNGNTPASKAHALLEQQKGVWELLRNGYDTLRTVRTRVFDFDGFHIKVQFNAGRMTSTVAKVDATSIKERKCFLCTENLPPAQRGIPCDGNYLVLCNPFPIFQEHFTISCLRHTPQLIRDSFGAFLKITRDLGTRYMVLYNGPRCGASAPDHLHFQAGNRSAVPLDAEFDALKASCASRLFESGSLRAWSVENCLRHFITFESADAGVLEQAFGRLYEAFQAGGSPTEEPMMNLLGFYGNGEWRIHFFPRAKHRPAFYFKEGDEKLLISPAAVELGGICTTPREQDFGKVTREHLVEMYNEVCVSPEKFASIKARLTAQLATVANMVS
jgi:hypothetical protein